MLSHHVRLGVNIDHVATLRQARGTSYPDPVHAAHYVKMGGGDSITIHLREDRRHIRERDVYALKETIDLPINLEIAATDEMLAIAEDIKPVYCCLVPENRHELTTEGGLDVISNHDVLKKACARLDKAGIRSSIFIDPSFKQIDAAFTTGAPAIELHTGAYANSNFHMRPKELDLIIRCANYADKQGLVVNAGHGLHYQNIAPIAAIPCINELNIGHSIVSQALFTGLRDAVAQMRHRIDRER